MLGEDSVPDEEAFSLAFLHDMGDDDDGEGCRLHRDALVADVDLGGEHHTVHVLHHQLVTLLLLVLHILPGWEIRVHIVHGMYTKCTTCIYLD